MSGNACDAGFHAFGATVVLVQRMLGHSSPSVTLKRLSAPVRRRPRHGRGRPHQAKINNGADQVRT
jgi:hypothetical protein